MSKRLVQYTCPCCYCKHEVELEDDESEEDYDGLCPPCEEAWVGSDEYQSMLSVL